MPKTKALPPHLVEVKKPKLSSLSRTGRGKHARFLQDISEFPHRWFIVRKFLIPLDANGRLGLEDKKRRRVYTLPYAFLHNMKKRYARDGFEFDMHIEQNNRVSTRIVVARYNPKRSK